MGILDAPAVSRASIFHTQLIPVATRASPPFDSGTGLSSGGITGGTAKLQHVMLHTAHGIRLAFSNWLSLTGSSETDTPNPIVVGAAIETTPTLMFPVSFNGQQQVTIQPGATVISDPIGIDITKGTLFNTRTFVQVAAGQQFPRCGNVVASSGEGNNYANPCGADLTRPGSASLTGLNLNTEVFGPSMILGVPTDPGKAVLGIIGDSISAGTADNNFVGWVQRGLNGNYAFQKVGFPGEAMSSWSGGFGATRIRRMALLAQCGVTHVLAEHIVNDLTLTLATIQANAILYWTAVGRLGPVWAPTCTPQTSSTDSWATTGNQTVLSSANEAKRVPYNAWLRDGAPILAGAAAATGSHAPGTLRAGDVGHPLAGYLEIADLCESARDSGIWKANYVGPVDGTHPNTTGATAIGSGIASTLAGILGAASA